jgi:hypothetical protein
MASGRSSSAHDDVDDDAPTREFVRPAAAVGVPPSQVRRFAQALAPFLAEELALTVPRGASIPPADVSRRRGKEMSKWRRERRAEEYSARTELEGRDGESSWSKDQAAELLGILKRKKKPSRSSDR